MDYDYDNYLQVSSDVPMASVGETTTWASSGAQGEAPPPGWSAAHPGKKFFPKKFAGVGKKKNILIDIV